VRIQTAMHLLSTTQDKIESVARSVGYQDPFSFSKAFKKMTGTPPRDFREADRETRNLAWRF
jgi:YesN/AraC family two-component response regulator